VALSIRPRQPSSILLVDPSCVDAIQIPLMVLVLVLPLAAVAVLLLAAAQAALLTLPPEQP